MAKKFKVIRRCQICGMRFEAHNLNRLTCYDCRPKAIAQEEN